MPRKVICISDPGIDGAFALSLALLDPELDVLAVAASPGNVTAEQATHNVHTVVEQLDPPRWPRVGAALPIAYEVDGANLHGPGGLGGVDVPCAQLHHPHPADKLIIDLVRQFPGEVTILVMGPPTTLARAMDRDPELSSLIRNVVCLGGSWREPGNATAVAEFHFYCDPLASRQVLRSGMPITLVPLDVMRKLLFSPSDLLNLPAPESRASRFLSKILPHAIRNTASLYGVEGFHLKDVVGVAMVSIPSAFTTRPMVVDVELTGDLTRGMSVFDQRWTCTAKPNVDMAMAVDLAAVRKYIDDTLSQGNHTPPAE
jgi:inosine-uridine nucleoside N-ribohydrolase